MNIKIKQHLAFTGFLFPGLLELGPITLGDFSSYACEAESHEHSRTSRMANLTQISGFGKC